MTLDVTLAVTESDVFKVLNFAVWKLPQLVSIGSVCVCMHVQRTENQIITNLQSKTEYKTKQTFLTPQSAVCYQFSPEICVRTHAYYSGACSDFGLRQLN